LRRHISKKKFQTFSTAASSLTSRWAKRKPLLVPGWICFLPRRFERVQLPLARLLASKRQIWRLVSVAGMEETVGFDGADYALTPLRGRS